MQLLSGLALALQATCALAAPSKAIRSRASPALVARQDDEVLPGANGPSDCWTAENRQCWRDGWDINTDFDTNIPHTGVTRQYTFDFEEFDNWVTPDGQIKEKAMLINGAYPGPLIRANWGDMIEVTVNNKLRINGTSLHWHGIRQLNNNVMDGANGVTECPIAPGKSKTYSFLAEQYGTSWYHSHFGSQYANGILGGMIIEGPASANYDTDLGILQIADFYYGAADAIQEPLNKLPVRAPPPSDNIWFNGKGIGPDGAGEYNRMKLQPGKTHRLRIVNPSVDNTYTISLAGHTFRVIGTDMVPVEPSEPLESLYVAVGQRYDLIIEADQAVDNYWFNVTLDSSGLCGTTNAISPAMIFEYEGAPEGELPSNPGIPIMDSGCIDDIGFVPVVKRDAPNDEFEVTSDNELDVVLATDSNLVKWDVRGQDINITWDEPTLEYVSKGITDFPNQYNIIHNDNADEWSFWLIQNVGALPHPMHLHGHDFLILGRSAPTPGDVTSDQFYSNYAFKKDRDFSTLSFNNPARRDVTVLPAWGWLALAFKADNPGAWLMHCHIAWHVSQGLGVQFLERVADIPSTLTLSTLEPQCKDWADYWSTADHLKYDSGL